MSSLDKDSGVTNIPTMRCPKCHTGGWYTAAGILIHFDVTINCS